MYGAEQIWMDHYRQLMVISGHPQGEKTKVCLRKDCRPGYLRGCKRTGAGLIYIQMALAKPDGKTAKM